MGDDTVRRACPWCGGFFLLDSGIALCPHCRKPVKAGEGALPAHQVLRQEVAEALYEKAEFWRAELAACAVEFGEAAVRGLRGWLGERGGEG